MTTRSRTDAPQQRPDHPTKVRLLMTAVDLLDAHAAEAITVEMVLSASEISLGSLYHHFQDMGDLIDSALVFRFARNVDRSIEWLREALEGATSADEFFASLKRVTRSTQHRELRSIRLERAGALYRAERSDGFRTRLAVEQQRLTDEITRIIIGAQEQGWVTNEVDARATAVLIQAYTLGRAVDDITDHPMDEGAWIFIIDRLAERVFRP